MEVAVSLPKYAKIISGLLPTGAMGVSLLLGSTAPSAAHEEATTSATPKAPVSDRLSAIRDAVSIVTGSESVAPGERQPMVAWWNGGWGWGWPNWNNWRNWSNWGNFWRNW
jgi:hypothetical protein